MVVYCIAMQVKGVTVWDLSLADVSRRLTHTVTWAAGFVVVLVMMMVFDDVF